MSNRRQTYTICARKLQTYVAGESSSGKPALLFLHGFPLDHTMWLEQLTHFATDRRVIAPDLAGFGGSEPIEGAHRMSEFADEAAELLAALGQTQPVVLCGLSMGGYIAFEFYRRHRERLCGLVLSNTRSAPDDETGVKTRRKTAETVLERGPALLAETMLPKLLSPRTREQRPEIGDSLKQVVLRTDPGSIAAALLGMAERMDSTPLLTEIDVPTLVMAGEEDEITPADEMRGMAEQIPDAEYHCLPNAGHMAPLESPEAFNAVLADFLERVPAT